MGMTCLLLGRSRFYVHFRIFIRNSVDVAFIKSFKRKTFRASGPNFALPVTKDSKLRVFAVRIYT